MMDKPRHQEIFKDPAQALQEAIEKLDVFTKPDASRLEVGEDGNLVATHFNSLHRIMGLARCYIGPLFSEQARQEQEKKLNQIKREILLARDIIKSHSSLIDKLKEGDSAQQKLAQSALEVIQRYNAVIDNDYASLTSKYDFYNYERNQILLDEEIKGQPIELPHTVSIKYDSHPNTYTAQDALKKLSTIFLLGADKKKYSTISSTHKKTEQFMLDTFRMKAVRMIQSHLSQQSSIAEVLNLVKQAPIEVEDEEELISMRQLLEVGPGSIISLTGSFRRHSADSKFMSMPILNSFRLTSETTQSGFPYPSQHTGWALANKLTEAHPLRTEQVFAFQQVDHRKKQLAHLLLFDPTYVHQSRQLFKLKRDVFDQNKEIYLSLHRHLHEAILESSYVVQKSAIHDVLDAFYHYILCTSSPFDILTHTQQRLLDLFITQPAKQIEEEWLAGESTPLRMGTHQERFQITSQRLEEGRSKALSFLNSTHPIAAYLKAMGPLLGLSSQSIILQYLSEKIGFAPPMLNDFERKIQTCAFQQLIAFLDQLEQSKETWISDDVKEDLFQKYDQDIKIFTCSTVEELDLLSSHLTNELEVYFNSRFYALHSNKVIF